jgi:hypothetical protein
MAARLVLPNPPTARTSDRMKALAGILVVATLTVGSGCAKTDWIDRTLVTVDVTGTWETVGSSTLQLELNQQGPNVTGYLRLTGFAGTPGSGPIVGSLAGDTFRFRQVNGSGEGEMTVSGDDMTGQIRGYPYLTRVTLGRVNPSSKSGSPPR